MKNGWNHPGISTWKIQLNEINLKAWFASNGNCEMEEDGNDQIQLESIHLRKDMEQSARIYFLV